MDDNRALVLPSPRIRRGVCGIWICFTGDIVRVGVTPEHAYIAWVDAYVARYSLPRVPAEFVMLAVAQAAQKRYLGRRLR